LTTRRCVITAADYQLLTTSHLRQVAKLDELLDGHPHVSRAWLGLGLGVRVGVGVKVRVRVRVRVRVSVPRGISDRLRQAFRATTSARTWSALGLRVRVTVKGDG